MKHKNGNNPFKNGSLENSNEEELENENQEPETAEENEMNSSGETEETGKLNEDYEKLNNQYIRLAADFENYRKRQEAERESLLRFGTESALTRMIEVLDNFERAEKALENIEDCQQYKDSFELLHKQVLETLTRLGMEPIEAEGKEFDPNFHDAVMQTPTQEYPENTVISELQKGYKLGDKVLRPSLVNVAAAG